MERKQVKTMFSSDKCSSVGPTQSQVSHSPFDYTLLYPLSSPQYILRSLDTNHHSR